MKTSTVIPKFPEKPGAIDAKDLPTKTNTLTPDLLHKMEA